MLFAAPNFQRAAEKKLVKFRGLGCLEGARKQRKT